MGALGGVLGSGDRLVVGRGRGRALTESEQQFGAHGVEAMVVGEVEVVDERKRCRWAVDLADCDSAVERHDRGGL